MYKVIFNLDKFSLPAATLPHMQAAGWLDIICMSYGPEVSGPVAVHHWVLPTWFISNQCGGGTVTTQLFFGAINVCVECNLTCVQEQTICIMFCFNHQKLAFELNSQKSFCSAIASRTQTADLCMSYTSRQIQLRILNVVVTSFQGGLVKMWEKCIKSSLWRDSIHLMRF